MLWKGSLQSLLQPVSMHPYRNPTWTEIKNGQRHTTGANVQDVTCPASGNPNMSWLYDIENRKFALRPTRGRRCSISLFHSRSGRMNIRLLGVSHTSAFAPDLFARICGNLTTCKTYSDLVLRLVAGSKYDNCG